MKPPAFDYRAPRTVDETVRLLSGANGTTTLLAGGQSLLPLLNRRRVRPVTLVDLGGVADLDAVTLEQSAVRIGALAWLRALETHTALRDTLPVLRETVRLVAYPQIRTRATLGGSLCHADPAAELPALALALGARLLLRSAAGQRTLDAEEFYRPGGGTALRPGELLTEVELPLHEGHRFRFAEVPRLGQGGFPLVGACAGVSLDADGTVVSARLSAAGAADRPLRLHEAEHALTGRPLTELGTTLDAAAHEADPPSDTYGSADYRRALLRTTLRRALEGVRP
ncbi:FAD binding domain-containing protein [Streptomyces sp. NPDC048172]|uniref:FAD binding domain-containing protein n=1 Tax=Streptomyces sp. NPDC048172 TaxID=3365505 RepID=UPI003717B59B